MEILTHRITVVETYFTTTPGMRSENYTVRYSKRSLNHSGAKTPLMFNNPWISRIIIFAFMTLVGFCLANAINSKSFIAILLALVSLGAGIYFLYLQGRMKEEARRENA